MKYKEVGKGISKSDLKALLSNSYKQSSDQAQNINGYIRDNNLSGSRAQVYHNPTTKETKVIHRGTSGIQDIFTDLKLLFSPKLYRNSSRYKHAEEIQNKSENKYGAKDIISIGHSLGARLASDVGSNSHEIINYQKPFLFYERKKPNEINLRTNNDFVSILGINKPNTINFHSNSSNPVISHNINQLDNLNREYIGNGIKVTNNELSNFEIIDICEKLKIQLNGVLPKDEVNDLKFGNYIINLNNHTQAGSHWVCVILKAKYCLYCDSFGLPPPQQLYDTLSKKYKVIYYNKFAIQDLNSILCGYFCISLLKFMKNKKNIIKEFTNYIKMFDSDTIKNDKILTDYFEE